MDVLLGEVFVIAGSFSFIFIFFIVELLQRK